MVTVAFHGFFTVCDIVIDSKGTLCSSALRREIESIKWKHNLKNPPKNKKPALSRGCTLTA